MFLLHALLAAVASVTSVSSAQLAVAPPAVTWSDRSTGPSAPALTADPAGAWSWPLTPVPQVARAFDPPDRPWLPGHRGVDLVATRGQDVLSPASGRVTFAGVIAGRGVVVVAHAGGLRSTFEPVDEAPPIGTAVTAGARVGRLAPGPTHCDPGTCLHWGVLRGRTYLDPLSFLGRRPILLLPLD